MATSTILKLYSFGCIPHAYDGMLWVLENIFFVNKRIVLEYLATALIKQEVVGHNYHVSIIER